MSLVVHSNPHSSNAQKVLFLLAELGLEAEIRTVPLANPRPDWHVAVNPLGGIPAIVLDGFELAESNTVLRFLASRAESDELYPAALQERATVNWRLDALATFLRPALMPIEIAAFGLRPGLGLGAAPPDLDDARAKFADALPKLKQFERLLDATSPWACCGRFTIADIAATPVLYRLLRCGVALDEIPRIVDWATACSARPAWATVAATAGV